MASLAGLYLGAFARGSNPGLIKKLFFTKLGGVYTYGGPMVIDNHDQSCCQGLCADVTFRHVYYNDIVPHLPPLSTGRFDHVGAEYRYHPQHGWKKRDEVDVQHRCFPSLSLHPLGHLMASSTTSTGSISSKARIAICLSSESSPAVT